MKRQNIFRSTFILAISLLCLTVSAQKGNGEEAPKLPGKPSNLIADNAPVFGGVAVSADLVGFAMKAVNARFANMEVAGRLNFCEKYFPIVELGIGDCTKTGSDNNNTFSCTAPFYRIGMDYNLNKKMNGNRFFIGLRYAFSRYNYDYDTPDFADPVWKVHSPLSLHNMKGKNQWLEIAIGMETKLWSIIRLGWNLRYKARLKQRIPEYGEPYYVPGFGKNGSSTFGGTVNLTFDIGKTAKKNITGT